CASLPLCHRSRPRLGSQLTRLRYRRAIASSPLTPSTMMLPASALVAPTSALRTPRLPLPSRWIHSAPAPVSPNPRPALLRHPLADFVDFLGRHFGVGLDRRVAVHLEQLQTDMVRILQHPLLAAVLPGDDPLGAGEGAVEQDHLQLRIALRDRIDPTGPERRV